MKTARYDHAVYYWTPNADPICHFYFDEPRNHEQMEESWKSFNIKAYVVSITDTETGEILYQRAKA
jgi:hypothetical protein